jgi:hypothetical protein
MNAYTPHLPARKVDSRLKQALTELQRAEKGAVLWFAEILNRKLYCDLGYSSMHQYAAVELKFGKARTAQFLRLAGALHDLPGLRRSLARGEVTWTKAREVARVATPKTERTWIDRARRATSRELEREVTAATRASRAVRTGAAGQGGFLGTDGKVKGGSTTLVAEVPVGLTLRFSPIQYARYEALMERMRKQGGHGSREELLLAALETAVAAGAERKRTRREQARRERKMARREAQLEHRAFPRGNTESPYQVVVQVCERCEAAAVETGQGTRTLKPETLKAILCDAHVRRRGERNRAAVPARLRRRVLERDRFRCRAAGCSRTRFLSVHHLVPREQGGENRPENLVTLCEGCHRAAHRTAPRMLRAG